LKAVLNVLAIRGVCAGGPALRLATTAPYRCSRRDDAPAGAQLRPGATNAPPALMGRHCRARRHTAPPAPQPPDAVPHR